MVPSTYTSLGDFERKFAVGTGGGGTCIASLEAVNGTTRLEIGNQILDNDISVEGRNEGTGSISTWPGDSSSLTLNRQGACNATSAAATVANGKLTRPQASIVWTANVSGTPLTTCGDGTSCPGTEACSGEYQTTITNTTINNCADLSPMYFTFSTHSTASTAYTSSNAECAAGSGRFFLVPILRHNRDFDGSEHVAFLPIQKTGTGVMTRQAWISAITPVNLPSGGTLRVVKQVSLFTFNGEDALYNATNISTVLPSGTTNFGANVLRGDPPFVGEELNPSNITSYEVDMTWTCGTGGTPKTLPQGYQFRLSDIGCSGNQKFTLRYATNPKRVYLELYGSPNYQLVEPTTTTSTGEAFAFDKPTFQVDATVLSTSSTQATVRIDEISLSGVELCTPGTYTFEAE
ncbi:MAG TPA: hypothetical protein PKY30_18430 [Myxococcota bacterium]|nr:hypothetical protein [Myxococcota bacterium]